MRKPIHLVALFATVSLPAVSLAGEVPFFKSADPFLYSGSLKLEATVVEKDLWTDAQFKEFLARQKASAKRNYPPGSQLDDVLKQIEASTRSPERENKFEVSFETDGKRFLYRYKKISKSANPIEGGDAEIICLYDGNETYQIEGEGNTVVVRPGVATNCLWMFPFMGQGYPFRRLVKPYLLSGKEKFPSDWPKGYELASAICQSSAKPDDSMVYRPALVSVVDSGGHPTLAGIINGRKGITPEDWSFSDFTDVGGHAFARKLVWKKYDRDDAGKVRSQRYERVYSLVSAEAQANPAHFELDKYLKKSARFFNESGGVVARHSSGGILTALSPVYLGGGAVALLACIGLVRARRK